jgi:putative ABC transport system permease protein
MLVGAFGLLGLILASVGVYGVIAYSVSQRTQELGIRVALGARPVNVIAMVLRQGMTLSLIGTGVGVTLAFLMLRAMRSVLYGVGSTDFPTLGAVSLLLLAVAFVASYIPHCGPPKLIRWLYCGTNRPPTNASSSPVRAKCCRPFDSE